MKSDFKVVLIGGSAGSLPTVTRILQQLPSPFKVPVVIIVHRQKNIHSEMARILEIHSGQKKIMEPEDKQPIEPGHIYLAPQNYHLLFEDQHTFSLDYSELVQYSRPSIDVTFESAASVFKQSTLCVLVSGSNNDGTRGIEAILQNGGKALVQEPASAEYNVMPLSALQMNPLAQSVAPDKIGTFITDIIG